MRPAEPGGGAGTGLVSVIVPTYNRAHLLPGCIASVLTQSYRPVEIIIVDDGSGDSTERVARSFPRHVRYIRQENQGVSAARNTGLRAARGDFVAFLDSDDRWLPFKLALQVAFLAAHPDVGMVWTDMAAIDPDGRVIEPAYLRTMYSAYRRVRPEDALAPAGTVARYWSEAPGGMSEQRCYRGDLFAAMLAGNLVHTSTVLLRRRRQVEVGGFDETLRTSGEDYDYHLRTAAAGPVGFIDATTIHYTVGGADQLTSPRYELQIARNDIRTIRKWVDHPRTAALQQDPVGRHLAASCAWAGRLELSTGQRHEAARSLWESFRLRPRLGVLALLALTLAPHGIFRLGVASRRCLRRFGEAIATIL